MESDRRYLLFVAVRGGWDAGYLHGPGACHVAVSEVP